MKFMFSIVLTLLVSCSTTSPDKNYKIAYNVLYDKSADDYEVFSMNMDGSNKINISKSKGVDWVYHASKDKLYFVSDRGAKHREYYLHEMDGVGKNSRKISDIRLRDSWFSTRFDNTEIIVNPHKSVDSVFYILNMNGDIISKLNTGMIYATSPCFSPDGKQVVFRGANKKFKMYESRNDELYLINVDGSGLKQLTYYPKNDTTAKWHSYKAGPPIWNHSENVITYQSFQDGKYSLFAVTPEGKQWKLTENKQSEGWHSWSSDGKWLAIELFDSKQTQFHIGLMNWETKQMNILTDTTYTYQQAPVFVEIKQPN